MRVEALKSKRANPQAISPNAARTALVQPVCGTHRQLLSELSPRRRQRWRKAVVGSDRDVLLSMAAELGIHEICGSTTDMASISEDLALLQAELDCVDSGFNITSEV